MPKVKIDDHLRGLVRNQYLHSLYRDNGTILSWAKQMKYFFYPWKCKVKVMAKNKLMTTFKV